MVSPIDTIDIEINVADTDVAVGEDAGKRMSRIGDTATRVGVICAAMTGTNFNYSKCRNGFNSC